MTRRIPGEVTEEYDPEIHDIFERIINRAETAKRAWLDGDIEASLGNLNRLEERLHVIRERLVPKTFQRRSPEAG